VGGTPYSCTLVGDPITVLAPTDMPGAVLQSLFVVQDGTTPTRVHVVAHDGTSKQLFVRSVTSGGTLGAVVPFYEGGAFSTYYGAHMRLGDLIVYGSSWWGAREVAFHTTAVDGVMGVDEMPFALPPTCVYPGEFYVDEDFFAPPVRYAFTCSAGNEWYLWLQESGGPAELAGTLPFGDPDSSLQGYAFVGGNHVLLSSGPVGSRLRIGPTPAELATIGDLVIGGSPAYAFTGTSTNAKQDLLLFAATYTDLVNLVPIQVYGGIVPGADVGVLATDAAPVLPFAATIQTGAELAPFANLWRGANSMLGAAATVLHPDGYERFARVFWFDADGKPKAFSQEIASAPPGERIFLAGAAHTGVNTALVAWAHGANDGSVTVFAQAIQCD